MQISYKSYLKRLPYGQLNIKFTISSHITKYVLPTAHPYTYIFTFEDRKDEEVEKDINRIIYGVLIHSTDALQHV